LKRGDQKSISLLIVAQTKELLHLYSELKNEYISLQHYTLEQQVTKHY